MSSKRRAAAAAKAEEEELIEDQDDDFEPNSDGEDVNGAADGEGDDEIDSDEDAAMEEDLQALYAASARPDKEFIYEKDAMLEKLKEIELKLGATDDAETPWIETLAITAPELSVELKSVHDDLKREQQFYNVTLANVTTALAKLEKLKVPYIRPADYYAEMLKTDEHMLKVKDHLLADKRRIDEQQDKVKQRQMKKYAKQVQVETKRKREQQHRDDVEAIKKWRESQKNADMKDEEFPEDLLDSKSQMRKNMKRDAPQKSKKRQRKDDKYGFGGSKRYKKSNDSDSFSRATSEWNTKQNKKASPGFASKTHKRPGKQRRQQQRGGGK